MLARILGTYSQNVVSTSAGINQSIDKEVSLSLNAQMRPVKFRVVQIHSWLGLRNALMPFSPPAERICGPSSRKERLG